MAELIYQQIITDLKKKIFNNEFPDMKLPDERSLAEKYDVSRSFNNEFPDMKLPDERSLAEKYDVSRSSIKRALSRMASDGIIFKKRGSGTFINPLYLKNESVFNYGSGKNLGISDNFQLNGEKPSVKVLSFDVVRPTAELQRDLFLESEDFVYQIKRLCVPLLNSNATSSLKAKTLYTRSSGCGSLTISHL